MTEDQPETTAVFALEKALEHDGSARGLCSGIWKEDLQNVKKRDPCLIVEVSVDPQSLQNRKIEKQSEKLCQMTGTCLSPIPLLLS